MSDSEKYGKLIFDSPTRKIYLSDDRGAITTKDEFTSCWGMPVTSTSYASIGYIKFVEKENMTFEIECAPAQNEVIEYILASNGLKGYELKTEKQMCAYWGCYAGERTINSVEFKNDGDYAFFKLKFHEQILDQRVNTDAR